MRIQLRSADVVCRVFALSTLIGILFLIGCGSSSAPAPVPATYTIGGTISGLTGSGLVLQDNGGNNLAVSAGATSFTFATAIANGGAYSVTVLTQPSSPVQNCVVTSGGSGTASANVTSVVISCTTTPTYTIGGTISGLTGSGLVLQDNGGNNLAVSAGATGFTFATAIANGGAYSVTVLTQPSSPVQNCVVTSGGSGTASANVTSVVISCTATSGNTVTGTASLGAPIVGATVTLKDVNGNTSTGTTASDGTFTLNTGGLTPPFLIKLVTATASGSFPAGTTLYSVSADANATTHINVHVLSDLIVRSFYGAEGVDPDTAFGNPVTNPAPPPITVQILANTVIKVMQLWLTNNGVTATGGTPSGSTVNLISSTFTANNTGLDAVLHSITSETVNATNGSVTAITITNTNTGGTVTETASPTYSGGVITVSTATTDTNSSNCSSGSSCTSTTTGSVSSTPPTSTTAEADVTAITAQLTALANTINTDNTGGTVTGSELLKFFASDYLNDGDNATEGAAGFAAEVAGLTISSFQIANITNLNTTTNVADVIVGYTVVASGQSQSGVMEFILKEEGGTWLIYGDQHIGLVQAIAQSRTSLGAGVTSGTYIFASVQAPQGVVTGAAVSGGGSIWPGNAASGTLNKEASVIYNGQNYDNFILISSSLGTNASQLPAAGTAFTFNLTTSSSGSPQYVVPSNNFTTETISFKGINSISGDGPLSGVVGKTLNYSWSLPTTYAVGQVSLYAYIYDGSPTTPGVNSCSIGGNGVLGTTSKSGSIGIPANMSACGLSTSDQIKAVDVFLEVDGINGEVNIVALSYPY